MKRYYVYMFVMLLLATSCDDWLDVRGENIQKEQDQYDNYKGFRDALTGCYMDMADTDAYGQRLTMTDIEYLADLWYLADGYETSEPEKFYLSRHKYDNDYSRSAVKAIYAKLFNVISSANVLLKNVEEKGSNIPDAKARAVIEGEAYAIRAYCQFDVLRLFGQVPAGGSKSVSLPYSYTTGIHEMPQYFAYADYVENLKKDIEKAEQLLKDNDPVFSKTFQELNNPYDADDDYMYYRQSRLNYWAVRALHARMALYIGDKTSAHDIAMEIINAKGAGGNAVMTLSGTSDLQKGYNGLPSECLFYLSKYDVNDYANEILIGGLSTQARTNNCFISSSMLNELYASVPGSMASHNRYLYEWNRTTKNMSSEVCPTIKKYWYDESKADKNNLIWKYQIIPMLRMSEVYLIAIETSESLAEVQNLYHTYMSECQYTLYTPFSTLDEAREEIVNEYRRELFAEGQMFFTYKRKVSSRMLWNDNAISEEDYIVPLPSTEYDPSIVNKK